MQVLAIRAAKSVGMFFYMMVIVITLVWAITTFLPGIVFAQEQPIVNTAPHVADCFSGCAPVIGKSVTCWAYAKLPDAAQGSAARCTAYCQYQDMPSWRPGPLADLGKWLGCSSFAPSAIGCNTTAYLFPAGPHKPNGSVVCDAGQIDGTITWDGTFTPAQAVCQ